ncbi:hypothetical protein Q7P37_000540 [Cladosporium fusiforme]
MDFLRDLGGIFGLHQGSAGSQERERQSHAEGSEDVESSAVKSKRGRSSEDHEPTPNKKPRRPSDDEYRLTGVGLPAGASKGTPIAFPAYSSQEPEIITEQKRPQTSSTMARKPGGNFKRTNTLNNAQAGKASRAGKTINPPYKKPATRAKDANRLERPVMVPLTHQHVGDGFTESTEGERKSKRRKTMTTMTRSLPGKGHTVLEVSDDESDKALAQGSVHAVNGEPVTIDDSQDDPQSPVVSIKSQPRNQSKYFGAQEARNVNQHTDPRPPKAARNRRGSSNNRTPSLSSLHRTERQRPGSAGKHQPAGIDDLAAASRLNGRTAPTDAGSSKQAKPPIKLGEGVDDFDVQQWKEEHQVKTVNVTMNDMHKNKTSLKRQPHSPPARQTQTATQKLEETPLRKQFSREKNTAPPQHEEDRPRRPSLVKNMKSISNRGERNSVEESPDQLAGGTTITSRKHTSEQSSRHTSPSDIRPTVFTSQNSKNTKAQSAQSAQQSGSGSEDGETRIPLKKIISRGCVLTNPDGTDRIELVWHAGEFEVQFNGMPYRILHRREIMAIGSHEAMSWHGAKDSNLAVIKGSKTPGRSNGFILLSFEDASGRDDCQDHLFAASKDTMKIVNEDAGRLSKIFEIQSKEVQLDARKHSAKAEAEIEAPAKQQATYYEVDNNRIRYEDSDEPAPARLRMEDKPEEVQAPPPRRLHVFDRPAATPGTRMSTRQTNPTPRYKSPTPPEPEKWTKINKPEPWNQSIVYPTQGARRVTVDFQDLERLDEGEFLNDNVVGYALRRIEETMAPEHKDKVHFFNTFFYTCLTNRNGSKRLNYDGVKKWMKKDLFEIPYIVVPINENLHWYVAIICNLPELARKPNKLDDDGSDAAATPSQSEQASEQVSPIRDPTVPDSQEADSGDKQGADEMSKLSLSDGEGRDTYNFGVDGKVTGNADDAEDEDLPSQPTDTGPARGGNKSKKRAPPPPKKYPVNRPTIITLDSLTTAHNAPVAFLKDYVRAAADDKRGMKVTRDDIQGMRAVGIPVQSNFCDCGLYLVRYVEEFAKDPQAFVNKVLTRQLDKEGEFASFDPSQKRDQLRDDLIGLHGAQNAAKQEQKKAKKMEKVAAATATAGQAFDAPAKAQALPSEAEAPTTHSSKAPSPARALSPKASSVASSGSMKAVPSQRPGAITSAHAPAATHQNANSLDGTGDSQELETAVPRALIVKATGGSSYNSEDSDPNRGKKSATSSGVEDEDEDEMLDSAGGEEADLLRKFHKVHSPEIDNLGMVFTDRERNARTSRTTSPDKRS